MLALMLCASIAATGGIGVSIEKFTISRDDSAHECFPSLTQTKSGRIVLVYRESDGHQPITFCRIIVRTSDDAGKTFSDRKVLIDVKRENDCISKYNCPKVQQLKDGRLLIVCDLLACPDETNAGVKKAENLLFFSNDNGETWSVPKVTGVHGIMPDEVVELKSGDWLLATHSRDKATGSTAQYVHRSADKGATWSAPITVASRKGYDFCEASIIEMPGGELICYMRENTGQGRPIYKCISTDGGLTWQGPFETLMGAGHRPVAHVTRSGKVLITYRHYTGGHTKWAKNTFAYLESAKSALDPVRKQQDGVILPLDHDRSPHSDSGYTGWVETAPGSFLAVNYIVDDAPKAQIRGYRFKEEDF